MTVIGAMIQQDPDKRPSVDQLQQHQQIQVRQKDAKLRQAKESLKKREAEVVKREAMIKEREREIEERKRRVREEEERLREMERKMEIEEIEMNKRYEETPMIRTSFTSEMMPPITSGTSTTNS